MKWGLRWGLRGSLTLSLLSLIISCGVKDQRTLSANKLIKNSPNTLGTGYGRILSKSPSVLIGNELFSPSNISITSLLSYNAVDQVFITTNPYLETSCRPNPSSVAGLGDLSNSTYLTATSVNSCIKVVKDEIATQITSVSGTWGYNPESLEFMEVHTFYHIKSLADRFIQNLSLAYLVANPQGRLSSTGGGSYTTALSPALFDQKAYWGDKELIAYSNCPTVVTSPSFFTPSKFTICYGSKGYDSSFPTFAEAQDPTVIHHETTHALVHIMLNQRSKSDPSTILRTDVGVNAFDEALALNEGICDFFTQIMSGLTRFGEWGVGRLYHKARPMIETDPIHPPGLGLEDNDRLAYPDYIFYDPNFPQTPIVDQHHTGMIASHFFTSFKNEIQSTCNFTHDQASNTMMYLIAETLGTLGDLTALGSSNQNSLGNTTPDTMVNLSALADPQYGLTSKLWLELANPINFRKFFQTFGKFSLKILPLISCAYTQDQLEKLMDKYGVLLFKTYNDNGNGVASGNNASKLTAVNPFNRNRSLLLSKNLLTRTPGTTFTDAYIFDTQADTSILIANLLSAGRITGTSPLIDSTLPFNNSNGKISPGEIVGVALKLYNASNTIMGGVQLLANDWDHGYLANFNTTTGIGVLTPCDMYSPVNLVNGVPVFPTATPTSGDCAYTTRYNGRNQVAEPKEKIMPICLVQMQTGSSTQLVGQKVFKDNIGLPNSQCLYPDSPDDCFVRALPGASQAYYDKINPQAEFSAHLKDPTTGDPFFEPNDFVVFEVSPYVPPGTTFQCRFRARFTNCDDCWHDPNQSNDDFLDYQFSGSKPFTLLDFQFQVID